MPFVLRSFLVLSLACAFLGVARQATAGAYLQEPYYGVFIAGVGVSEGSRRFDQSARPRPAPAYRKART